MYLLLNVILLDLFFREEYPKKRLKLEDETDDNGLSLNKLLESQNKLLYSYKDNLKQLKQKELKLILEYNEQEVLSGIENVNSLYLCTFYIDNKLILCLFIEVRSNFRYYGIWCFRTLYGML